jgi:hypothetical protein
LFQPLEQLVQSGEVIDSSEGIEVALGGFVGDLGPARQVGDASA